MTPVQLSTVEKAAVYARVAARVTKLRLENSQGRGEGKSARLTRSGLRNLPRAAQGWAGLLQAAHDKKFVRFGEHVYFDAFSPRFPGPVFDRVVEANIHRAQGKAVSFIPYVILAITDRCMYRCEHCYAKEVIRKRDSLTLEQWKHIMDRFLDVGTGVFGLEGGEPLIRFDDLVELCTHGRDRSEMWLATTGFGLTAGKAKRLADAGLVGAAISLDHYDPDKHNEFRGSKRAFDEAAKAVALFAQAGVFPAVTVCATRGLVADGGLQRYLELAHQLGAGVVQVLDPVPTGSYLGCDVGLSVAELRDLQRFQRVTNTDASKRVMPAVSTRASLEDDHTFGCGGGGNAILYVDPAGNLQPCPFLSVSTGNVVTEDFDEVLGRMTGLFPHPPAVSVICPANTLGAEIAQARERTGKLPLPWEETREICGHFADLPTPLLYAGKRMNGTG